MTFEYWFYCAMLHQSVQYGKGFYALFTLVWFPIYNDSNQGAGNPDYVNVTNLKQVWVFLTAFNANGGKRSKYYLFLLQVMMQKVSYFYVFSICFIKLLFKLIEMKKNAKLKAGFRWTCVLKSMFILLFTRINYEHSSIVSKISIYLATHVRI